MSFIPTEEMKAAYRTGCRTNDTLCRHLVDLAQHALAAALKAEFMAEHYRCNGVEISQCAHPLHKADWLELADEKLREAKP